MARFAHFDDLHGEFESGREPAERFRPAEHLDVDAIILGGDIDTNPKRLRKTILEIRASQNPGVEIIYILGNHEFYGNDWVRAPLRYGRALAGIEDVHFLNNSAVQLRDGTRVIGGTLWTDVLAAFKRNPDLETSNRFPMDYIKVRAGDGVLRPEMVSARHRATVAFIEHELATHGPGQVVVTHHAPSRRCIDPNGYAAGVEHYYANELDALIERCRPSLWFHGHIHEKHDIEIGATRVLNNPRGYWPDGLVEGFDERGIGVDAKIQQRIVAMGLDIGTQGRAADNSSNTATQRENLRMNGPYYAGVGARRADRCSPEAAVATAIAQRLERLGYTLRSGGAIGADYAFERGVSDSRNKCIYRPISETPSENRTLPPGYRVPSEASNEIAMSVMRDLVPNFDSWNEHAAALHARNCLQIFGSDFHYENGKVTGVPVDFVVCIAPDRAGGTRTAIELAERQGIPVFNLTVTRERELILERLAEMEADRGLERGADRVTFTHHAQNWELPRGVSVPKGPITIEVGDVRKESKLDAPRVYIGRSMSDNGYPDNAHASVNMWLAALANPFKIGRDASSGLAAERFADVFSAKLARNDGTTVEAMQSLATIAMQHGKVEVACFSCGKCHGSVIAVALGERLERAGMEVRYTMSEERLREVRIPTLVERQAKELIETILGREAERDRSPWTRFDGEVIASSPRDVAIATTDGKYRSTFQPEGESLRAGTYVQVERHGLDVNIRPTTKNERDQAREMELVQGRGR